MHPTQQYTWTPTQCHGANRLLLLLLLVGLVGSGLKQLFEKRKRRGPVGGRHCEGLTAGGLGRTARDFGSAHGRRLRDLQATAIHRCCTSLQRSLGEHTILVPSLPYDPVLCWDMYVPSHAVPVPWRPLMPFSVWNVLPSSDWIAWTATTCDSSCPLCQALTSASAR